MGKNISVYLDDDLLDIVKSSNQPPSKIIQMALKKYYLNENRQKVFDLIAKTARELGKKDRFFEVIKDWQSDRGSDRW